MTEEKPAATAPAERYKFSQTDTEVIITIEGLPKDTKKQHLKMDTKASTLKLQIHDEVPAQPLRWAKPC